jgi:hypothetical protein
MENVNENQNQTFTNKFIIPEWKQTKDAILDSYFLTVNSMSEVIPKYYIERQIVSSSLNSWRKGAVSLYYQICLEEPEEQLRELDPIQEIQTISSLLKFTKQIFATKTIKDIRSISRSKGDDPIQEYKTKAYK